MDQGARHDEDDEYRRGHYPPEHAAPVLRLDRKTVVIQLADPAHDPPTV